MNSAPHLLNEDRAEFARILDEALRTAAYRPDDRTAAAAEHRLSTEQLRVMALSATSAIAACATAEYQRYIQLRAELRAPAPTAYGVRGGSPSTDRSSDEGCGPDTADEPAADAAGFGLAAMATVLVPVLAGIAAVLFLVIGYVLRAVDPDPAVSRPLVSVGWIFAVLAAAGALVAMGCVLVTALRNGASRDTAAAERAAALDSAHGVWREALLERGLLPFLREALADPSADPTDDPARYVSRPLEAPERRTPTLGYTRPRFASPDSGASWSGPRYSRPDFSSPDYGGTDQRPE